MFGKSESERPSPDSASAREVSAKTVIGAGAQFVGDLSAEDEVVVAGRLEGQIRGARQVRVAPEGEVEGDIDAHSVLVAGRVSGNIRAGERTELSASAIVEGGIQSPKIVIAEGAQLTGSVGMAGPASKESKSKEE